MKKIVLVGPVYPYKGGISHYTGLMYKALSKKYQVVMVSYKLQYPKSSSCRQPGAWGGRECICW